MRNTLTTDNPRRPTREIKYMNIYRHFLEIPCAPSLGYAPGPGPGNLSFACPYHELLGFASFVH